LSSTAKSLGLSQAKPKPSWQWWLWPGSLIHEAKATSSQAKALHLIVTPNHVK